MPWAEVRISPVGHAFYPGVITLPLPLMVFFWGTLSNPRPSKSFWVAMIAYTEFVVSPSLFPGHHCSFPGRLQIHIPIQYLGVQQGGSTDPASVGAPSLAKGPRSPKAGQLCRLRRASPVRPLLPPIYVEEIGPVEGRQPHSDLPRGYPRQRRHRRLGG